jgi:type IV pilus assembly protein PilE
MRHPAPLWSTRHRAAGLTLIELLVVVVVLGLLAAIVLPSYQQSLYKSRRSDAMRALATMQQAQERWRGNNTTYQDTLANLSGASAATSPSGNYDLSIVANSVTATGYTLRATASAAGKQAGDATCQIFEVQVTNGTVTYASYAAGGAQNGAPDPCWVR